MTPNNPSNPAVLSIRNLCVQLKGGDGKTLVSDLSLQVHAGETLCIVGESGSGKSLTSLATMGLLPADSLQVSSGVIELDGKDLLRLDAAQMRALRASQLAMVFQEPMTALNPVHRVGKQIEEVLKLHSTLSAPQRRTKVLQMLEAVHLPDIERIYDSYPHQLSGGQRQRIVIAMALILKPRLLIADEPTTALDVTTQKQILSLMRELQEKHGTAVVFITHDFGVVAEIADRILVMNRGKVVESGTREEILARPLQEYTRMLVSSVPSLVPHARAQPEGETILQVRSLNKTYPKSKGFLRKPEMVLAASEVSLTLKRGEILGIVGESGSGKSTVARCIVRLIDPSGGEIRLKQDDITRLSRSALLPLRKRIQIVFQDPYRSLNPRRRIGDSVIEGLLNYGMPRDEAMAKATEAMDLVGLPRQALDRFPHQFSGGQRQRICIARALVMEPDVLVADEAVSALDVSVQAQVLDLLEEVRQRVGIGVLFITHDLRVAAQICDSIMVMKSGQVVEAGTVQQVLGAPQQAYTQALIDAAPGRHWDFQNFRPVTQVLAA
ncbi:ABC transporter ATP-binding protein [Comamonas terrigena]|jgi:peptide/nickel transport system ATP-binding protein|uniref:ABC transporter ATP-binding protein n=1 Tax=Comamonas terrigena TaxID=32013 RepID=UPI00244BA4F0|nr:ABC transporter ATP-binding protein [Comamonas terrigena]MDH0047982.1 ABC transporter ATP-binding protein [Comamonas terrigena]MDH0510418.1 ABC transporter ATP-binding protein [Comamonas terrigena]MDH1090020.1 ABC transporter ATP-binding protein [Comamonas terrigena]MDH1290209.1 ABC transporter ATP-binding protein [Comamonas terrigena]MDH1499892.1 ABC transporter ATP-binding protein [Comamonas terrigena]